MNTSVVLQTWENQQRNLVPNTQEAESERIQSPVEGTAQKVEERVCQHAECRVASAPRRLGRSSRQPALETSSAKRRRDTREMRMDGNRNDTEVALPAG